MNFIDRINNGHYKNNSGTPEEQKLLEHALKYDMLEDVGLAKHPKAEKAYSLAYEKGHCCGYSEVYSELCDLAELLLDK